MSHTLRRSIPYRLSGFLVGRYDHIRPAMLSHYMCLGEMSAVSMYFECAFLSFWYSPKHYIHVLQEQARRTLEILTDDKKGANGAAN